jgi:hypothetical protein
LILFAFSLTSFGQTPSDLTITPFPETSLYPGMDINGLQIARASNGNYILITESQQELIPRQYGYTAMDWDRITDTRFSPTTRHTGSYLVTASNILDQDVMGVIDKSGNVIIPLVHSNLTNPAEETTSGLSNQNTTHLELRMRMEPGAPPAMARMERSIVSGFGRKILPLILPLSGPSNHGRQRRAVHFTPAMI